MMPKRHLAYDLPPAKTRWEHFTHWLRRWWPWVLVVVVSLMLVGRSQLQSEQLGENTHRLADTVARVKGLTQENRHLTTSLQSAIVESCEKIGNERAQAQREQLHEEIMEAEHPDPEVIAAFNLPEAKINELIAENVAKLKGRLHHIKLVDCASQYHISPGSGGRRRDSNADSSTP
jgi:hypothetical protein